MSEIPDSIKRTVLDIYADHWERDGLIGEADELRRMSVDEAMKNLPDDWWFGLIARALMAEREACARIVEENDEWLNQRTSKRTLAPRIDGNPVGLAYAEAIRNR